MRAMHLSGLSSATKVRWISYPRARALSIRARLARPERVVSTAKSRRDRGRIKQKSGVHKFDPFSKRRFSRPSWGPAISVSVGTVRSDRVWLQLAKNFVVTAGGSVWNPANFEFSPVRLLHYVQALAIQLEHGESRGEFQTVPWCFGPEWIALGGQFEPHQVPGSGPPQPASRTLLTGFIRTRGRSGRRERYSYR